MFSSWPPDDAVLVSKESVPVLSSVNVDVSCEPLCRAEELRDVSGFLLEIFFLIFDLPPVRLGLVEDFAD